MATRVSWKNLVPLVSLLVLGCAEDQLRSRAASDLSCDPKQVEITATSTYSSHYLASGCGRFRYYTCLRGGCVHDD